MIVKAAVPDPVSPLVDRRHPDDIAAALGRQTGSRVAPSGALAANRLGLSTQVPARPVYLTDGRTRQVRAGDRIFVLKHVPPKNCPRAGAPARSSTRRCGTSAGTPWTSRSCRGRAAA
jgi:hypothetical protein